MKPLALIRKLQAMIVPMFSRGNSRLFIGPELHLPSDYWCERRYVAW